MSCGPPSSYSVFCLGDPLMDALDRLDGVHLLDLGMWWNMVLLCHAIVLVLLGDAGILGHIAIAAMLWKEGERGHACV